MTAGRYAIYFSAKTGTSLDLASISWLGRDARTGAETPCATISGINADRFYELTADARHYGFHGTLKAPFHLVDGATETDLLECAENFAQNCHHFQMPSLQVSTIAGFLALVPRENSESLQRHAFNCVRAFDHLRAPLTEQDYARRKWDTLTQSQKDNLVQWGYPYVDDEFRFHMTLTSRVQGKESELLQGAARRHFESSLSARLECSSLTIFAQKDRSSAFQVILETEFPD